MGVPDCCPMYGRDNRHHPMEPVDIRYRIPCNAAFIGSWNCV